LTQAHWTDKTWVPSPRFNLDRIERLRPRLAAAADAVVQAWEQDPEEGDPELGWGGPCDRVNEALQGVLAEGLEGSSAEIEDGGQDGDDHAWTLVTFPDGAVVQVDVPARVYETGGGYVWTKRPNAKVRPEDVSIALLDPPTQRGDGRLLTFQANSGDAREPLGGHVTVEVRSHGEPRWLVWSLRDDQPKLEGGGATCLEAMTTAMGMRLVREDLGEPVWFPEAPTLKGPEDAWLPRPALLAKLRPK
jgi:hypothetical protein